MPSQAAEKRRMFVIFFKRATFKEQLVIFPSKNIYVYNKVRTTSKKPF